MSIPYKHSEAPKAPKSPESPERVNRKTRALGRLDTRAALIRRGTAMCTERGFQLTSIDELLRQVGVTKGSFYHFFRSKHEFGEAVIENYAQYFQRKLDRILNDNSRTALGRMHAF